MGTSSLGRVFFLVLEAMKQGSRSEQSNQSLLGLHSPPVVYSVTFCCLKQVVRPALLQGVGKGRIPTLVRTLMEEVTCWLKGCGYEGG